MGLGPELLTNAGFDTGDMGGWTVNGDVTNVDDAAYFDNVGPVSTYISQDVLTLTKMYRVAIVVNAIATGLAFFKLGWTGEQFDLDAPGIFTFTVPAIIAGPFILDCNYEGTLTIESVSVREVISVGRYVHVLKDYDSDKQQISFGAPDLNAGNIVAQLALADSLESAIEGVTIGVTTRRSDLARDVNNEPIAGPAGIAAQAHFQWLVTYQDDVNSRIFTGRIGTADVDDDTLLMPASTLWDPAAADWVQFITDFEALVLSEDGNAVSIVKVELVE